jgi:hypothetical protein
MHSWVEVASNAFAAIFREAEPDSLLSGSSVARASTIK